VGQDVIAGGKVNMAALMLVVSCDCGRGSTFNSLALNPANPYQDCSIATIREDEQSECQTTSG
jgi:hypothetical protein